MTQNNKKIWRGAAWLVGVGVLGVAVLSGTGLFPKVSAASAKPSAAANAPVSVTTVRALDEDVPIYAAGVGTVQPNASVTLKTRVDGQLEKVGFVEGQDVKAGQMISQLDQRPFQAQLAQIEAQKARDQAQLANAKLDLQRYNLLIKDDAVTRQTLEAQKAQVLQLEATVKTDEAQVNYAKVQLDYTTITAPLAGRIGARLVDPGNIVHAADAAGLAVINQVDPIAVVFTMPEESFQAIDRAMQDKAHAPTVLAYARDGDQVLAKGAVVLLNNTFDTSTGTVQLKGRFPNPAHALWPGQYVNVHLVLGTRAHAVTIPAAAVQRNQTGTYVYGVNPDNTAQIMPIKLALIQDGKAIVDQGLKAGTRVVLDGQYKLKPGSPVVEGRPAATPAIGKGAVS